ncbi:hypothetical protein J1614_009046 [Plenodomus biglobosus]|nr:hypothetical protein J1614_009046 [Plenodomus biglobosus]
MLHSVSSLGVSEFDGDSLSNGIAASRYKAGRAQSNAGPSSWLRPLSVKLGPEWQDLSMVLQSKDESMLCLFFFNATWPPRPLETVSTRPQCSRQAARSLQDSRRGSPARVT